MDKEVEFKVNTMADDGLHPSQLNVGDTFYECEYGQNIKCVVKTKPVKNKENWTWISTDEHGNEIDYLYNDYLSHYAPKIYSSPQYVDLA